MYIDISEEVAEAVNEFLADGGNVATYDEMTDLIIRVEALEKALKDLDFWKADRNHSHNKLVSEDGKTTAFLN